MKKIFLISVLTIAMCLLLSGCGKENNISNNPTPEPTNDNTNANKI